MRDEKKSAVRQARFTSDKRRVTLSRFGSRSSEKLDRVERYYVVSLAALGNLTLLRRRPDEDHPWPGLFQALFGRILWA